MCNKYRNRQTIHQIGLATRKQLELPLTRFTNEPVPEEVFPRRPGLILRPIDPLNPIELEAVIGHWNLTPFFHDGPFKEWKASTNNARADRMANSPAFRDAFRKRRAIIPASSFCEWTGPKGSKTEHDISHRDGTLFLAGLWELSREGLSYTMVTTDAGDDVRPFHDRQPVALDRNGARTWLDLSSDHQDVLTAQAGRLLCDPPEPVAAY